MENKENTKVPSLKQCSCNICQGALVNPKTFHLHSIKSGSTTTKRIIPNHMFDENLYRTPKYQRPLYEGTNVTVLDAVFEHLFIFSTNNGLSKSALTQTLLSEKSRLPQPNELPASYRDAKKIIKPLLMPVERYDACINDCIIYRGESTHLDRCPNCNEPRKTAKGVQKSFTYMPIGPRLSRWFGTSNLCKLLYAGKVHKNGKLCDFTDGTLFESWYSNDNVFSGRLKEETVPLALFTDGVNPNRHMSVQKSMWPIILTWINLPIAIRQLLGPMMLVGVVPSGKKGAEPSLDVYMDRLVEELLALSEFPVYHSYLKAPITIKVALLQYLCDIPAYAKLLHVSAQGALRSCAYCKEEGTYCKHLKKTIHLSNRRFLPEKHPLRQTDGFPNNSEENRTTPQPIQHAEEKVLRDLYDNKPNKSQKAAFQKETGVKGNYSFMKLPYHNRVEQMQPDGMHTIADFIGHVIDTLTGKEGCNGKTRHAEKSFGRFKEIWPKDQEEEDSDEDEPLAKVKRQLESQTETEVLPPWTLSKENIKEADRRAATILYPDEVDIAPGPHFSKPWTLRTMNSKLQFVRSGAFKHCIEGLLPKLQEDTLVTLFDVLKRLTSHEYLVEDIPKLQADTHIALSLFERDFPLSLQNLTTHLIHHIADGIAENGPLYGRWLFPYERANGWISRQTLQKVNQEATIMETYVIYDWCAYMFLSQKLMPNSSETGSIREAANFVRQALSLKGDVPAATGQKIPTSITTEEFIMMKPYYEKHLDATNPVLPNTAMRCNYLHIKKKSRMIKYHADQCMGRKKKGSVVVVRCHDGTCKVGQVNYILEHGVSSTDFYWLGVEVMVSSRTINGQLYATPVPSELRLIHVSDVSEPLVTCEYNGHIKVLSEYSF